MQEHDVEQVEQNEEPKIKGSSQQRAKFQKKSALDFRKYTKQIWLAGLGAFSRAEEEGNKLFDSLVKVGEELESKTVESTDSPVTKTTEKNKESVAEAKDKVEKLIDQSVNHSLNRIGLVTAKDLQHLESLIIQLHNKVDALAEENQKLHEQLLKK